MNMSGGSHRLSNLVLAAAGLELVVALVLGVTPNPEGPLGGFLYALLVALPLGLAGWLLRSERASGRRAGGALGILLGLFYLGVLALNWQGYDTGEAVRALVAIAPAGVVSLVAGAVALTARRPA